MSESSDQSKIKPPKNLVRFQNDVKLDPYKYMEEFVKEKEVQITDFEVPFAPEFIIYDLALILKGAEEDSLFARSYYLRKNIRRGNTVIQQLSNQGGALCTYWGRQGMEKFFDLYRDHIQYNLSSGKNSLGATANRTNSDSRKIYAAIFDDIIEAIQLRNSQVEIIKMEKTNGQNAQISYFSALDAWVIASQNVSLALRRQEDINQYENKQRFDFARLIATQWFRIIDEIEKKKGKQFIQQLKDDIQGYTLIGEYIGNPAHQHLVQYDQTDIRFFAIVDHNSVESCIDPLEAIDWLSQFGLSTVQYERLGVFKNFLALNATLLKVYDQVSSAILQDQYEGGVLYFVETPKNKKQSRVISLCKLKTIQYRIYRKLREKLRNFLNEKGQPNKSNKLQQFQSEIRQLGSFNQPPKPFEFYDYLAEQCFKFAEDYFNDSVVEIIHEEYITFLSVVLYAMNDGIQITPSLFKPQSKSKLLKMDWSQYNYENMIKDYVKDLKQIHNENNGQDNNERVLQFVVKEKEKEKQRVQFKGKHVLIIVPIGVPGMGKTTMFSHFQSILDDSNAQVLQISSDEFRQNEIQQLRAQKINEKQNFNEQDLFDQSRKSAVTKFDNMVKYQITTGVNTASSNFVIILIDQNHPPNGISKTIELIQKHRYKIAALVPSCLEQYSFTNSQNQVLNYPFSLNFMVNCIRRVQARQNHPTLKDTGHETFQVLSMFFNMYQNVDLSEDSVMKNGFDLYLSYPYIQENSSLKGFFGQKIQDAFRLMMSSIVGADGCLNKEITGQLESALGELSKQYPEPAADLFEIKIRQIISRALSKFFLTEQELNENVSKIFKQIQKPKLVTAVTNTNNEQIQEPVVVVVQERKNTSEEVQKVQQVHTTVENNSSQFQKDNNNNNSKQQNQNKQSNQNSQVKIEYIVKDNPKKSEPENIKLESQNGGLESQEVNKVQSQQAPATKESQNQKEEEVQANIQTKPIEVQPAQQYIYQNQNNPVYPGLLKRKNKRVAPVKYNPTFKFQYLGIFAKDTLQAQKIIREKAQIAFQTLIEKFKDESSLQEAFEVFKDHKKCKVVPDPHVTAYYPSHTRIPQYFDNFEDDLQIDIKVNAIVIVPNCIITGITYVDENELDIETKIPHLTMLLGDWKAVFSNDILETLFLDQKAPLQAAYDQGFFIQEYNRYIAQFTIEIKGGLGKHSVYVVQGESFSIPGVTRTNVRK